MCLGEQHLNHIRVWDKLVWGILLKIREGDEQKKNWNTPCFVVSECIYDVSFLFMLINKKIFFYLFVKFEVNTLIENSCGLCGWYGSEAKKFRRPSGHIARDEVSFVQSWVVPDKCGGGKQNLIACFNSHQQSAPDFPLLCSVLWHHCKQLDWTISLISYNGSEKSSLWLLGISIAPKLIIVYL